MMKIERSLAAKIGCHPTYLDKLNSGKLKPSVPMCKKIIAVLQEEGHKLTLFDLRPDLKEMVINSL